MRVGLFIPCYIDQFYPSVARATLEILEKGGATVLVPDGQTCCGQPLGNSGYERFTHDLSLHTAELFDDCELIVSPSGSCTAHINEHIDRTLSPAAERLSRRTIELTQFLHRFPEFIPREIDFPFRTGIHQSCHGLRWLRSGHSSEQMLPHFSILEELLSSVKGIEICRLDRADECCGFGGTFAVQQEAVSVSMGEDRLNDHIRNGVEVITGTDSSCLMHLEGLARRKRLPLRCLHVAEILNPVTTDP
jgi:L-lactate dehydrogenase complex protein LldE